MIFEVQFIVFYIKQTTQLARLRFTEAFLSEVEVHLSTRVNIASSLLDVWLDLVSTSVAGSFDSSGKPHNKLIHCNPNLMTVW